MHKFMEIEGLKVQIFIQKQKYRENNISMKLPLNFHYFSLKIQKVYIHA